MLLAIEVERFTGGARRGLRHASRSHATNRSTHTIIPEPGSA